MTKLEIEALERIATQNDVNSLKKIASNAQGKSPEVERAALRRLASISAQYEPGTVENACWTMVHAIEELRRLSGRKVRRMNRMRAKIAKDGEIEALRYCTVKETAGFAEVIAYGTPELTAEAIVLCHADNFDAATLTSARQRLSDAGVDVERLISD